MIKKLLFISYGFAMLLLTCFQTNAQETFDPNFKAVPLQKGLKQQSSSSKLSPQLKELYESFTASRQSNATARTKPAFEHSALTESMEIRDGLVLVDITVREYTSSTRAQLEKLGLKINAVYGRMVSGRVPISSLNLFESVGSIQSMQPSYRSRRSAKPIKAFGTKSVQFASPAVVISQGDTALRAYLARAYSGATGKGVKVGILSDSYNNLGTADIGVKNGELPGPGNPYGFTKPVQVLSDLDDTSGIDEGRGMAEIVHDVAPGAEIVFYTAFNGQADFANGIIALAEAGCTVIVDDVFYYAEPFFQDGIIAQAIDRVKDMGVAYFSAAGNSGANSYQNSYKPSTFAPLGAENGTAHNFAAPGATPVYYQPVFLPRGATFLTSFQWDQPFYSAGGVGSSSDLDIFLLNASGQIVALSLADNIGNGDPVEVMGYGNNTASTVFYVLILKYAGPDPTYLKCVNYGSQTYLNPSIPGQSGATIVGHANAEGAISTGAAFYLQTPAYGSPIPMIENFMAPVPYGSSLGGQGIYYDIKGNRINPPLRKKPDLTSVDGGNTSFFPPFVYFGRQDIRQDSDTFPNFFGTSAAAPHAAAVAALMIEAQKLKTLTPSQIKGIMTTTTIDMDNPFFPGFDTGFDFATGAGFLQADAAVSVVKFPNVFVKSLSIKAVCSDDPEYTRKWVISNPNPFDVEVHWQINGFSQQGSITAGPGETTFTTQTVYFFNNPVANIILINWNDNLGIPHFALAGSSTAECGKTAVTEANTDRVTDLAANAEVIGNTGSVSVYPNPILNNFRISLALKSHEKTDLSIYTLEGRLLLRKSVNSTGVIDIDAGGYAPGMYILKVQQKDFNKTFKIIKK